MAVPTPSGIGVGKPAGAVAKELGALAGFPPVRGSPCQDARAVAGDGHNPRHKPHVYGWLDADFRENLLQQSFRPIVETTAFQSPVNQLLDYALALVRHLVFPVLLLRLALLGLDTWFLIEFDDAVYEVVVRRYAGEFATKPAGNLEDTVLGKFFNPLVKRIPKVVHQYERAKDFRLVFGWSAGCGVQRREDWFQGVEVQYVELGDWDLVLPKLVGAGPRDTRKHRYNLLLIVGVGLPKT